ncbi:MAG: DUF4136 domain-containing protein [Pseudomonadota bacterium]
METVLKTVALALLLALVSGCARYAVTDYDSGAGFDSYSTYRFADRGEDSVQGLDAARIERALKRALADEGFTQADAEPDVLMRYRIEDEVRTESRGPRLGLGFGFGRSPFTFGVAHSPVQTREIREGQLVVEMVDPTIEQIVWEGRGQRFLSESQDREERTELIEQIIEAMFEQYPPQ